jgi:hypothetical protein
LIPHLPTLFRLLGATFSRAYFSVRHATVAVLFLSGYTAWFLLVTVARALDRVLFPAYRATEVKAPIYILGPPRAGTTFLHRLLARDPQFTALSLYNTMTPTVVAYRLWSALGALDRRTGGVLQRAMDRLNRRSFAAWEGVHSSGLDLPEEDETWWMMTLLTPALAIFFPFLHRFPQVKFVDRLPPPWPERLTRYLRDAAKRHMYAVGEGKTLLGKNVIAAGRLERYTEAFPDMRIIPIVRHPYGSVPSIVSMLSTPWTTHSPHLIGPTRECYELAKLSYEQYRTMIELKERFPPERFLEIRFEEAVSDPEGTVRGIYEHFGLPLSPEFARILEAEGERARRYRSGHRYDLSEYGLSEQKIYEDIPDVFAHYKFER